MPIPEHIRKAIDVYIPPLEGWFEPERCHELAELIIEHHPRTVVEIGTFGGRSALAQAFALRDNNDGGKIFCIDPWRFSYAEEGEWKDNVDWWGKNIDLHEIHKKCMEAIWGHNIDRWLVVIRAASQYCYELFPSIDQLLIDGNHSEIASLRDAELYVPRVKKGGFIIGDDFDWEVRRDGETIRSTEKARQFIEVSCDLVKQIGNMRIYQKR